MRGNKEKYNIATQILLNVQIYSVSRIILHFWGTNNIFIDCTVGENIIATIKILNNFWYPLKMVNFPILQ